MTKTSSIIWQSFKDAMLFVICYFFLFFILIATFSDGSYTTGMFVLIDFFVTIILTVYFLMLDSTIQTITGKTIGILTKALLFVVLAELAVLTLTGQLPLFGLLQKYIYSKKPYSGDKSLDDSIYLFRQSRDFAFSIAGLTSAILFLIIKRLTKKKNSHKHTIGVIPPD
jgi:hypothetical protein